MTRRPDENGLGLQIEQAVQEIDAIKELFALCPMFLFLRNAKIWSEGTRFWKRIVMMPAWWVLPCIQHELNRILTFNVEDFIRYAAST